MPHQSPPVKYASTTVTGRVIDINGEPLNGAKVYAAAASTMTDINGRFTLSNIQLDEYAAYLAASKDGFFNGSKTFQFADSSFSYVQITLIAKNQAGQFNASTGGNVAVGNKANINFPGNSIVDPASNSAYSGTVTVYAYYLDPSAKEFLDIMPGEMVGIAKDSSEKMLQSYGMVVAELAGSAGQNLNIAPGKTSTVTFTVPSGLLPSVPQKIPLWYFDEVKGLWREQDTAFLQGNSLIANVSHFSFWNCDAKIPIVQFKLHVTDEQNNPLSAIQVGINSPDNASIPFAKAYTDASGNIGGAIPANMNLRVTVFDRCGGAAFTSNFTTTQQDINLGTVKANVQMTPVTFSGSFTTCVGAPITNGNIRIFLDGFYTVAPVTNGSFSVTINRCYATATTAQIIAGDLNSNLVDTLSIQNITNTNFPSLQLAACDQSDQFVIYTLKGQNDTLTLVQYSFNYLPFVSFGLREIAAMAYNNPADFFHIKFYDSTALNKPQTDVLLSLTNYDSVSGNTVTLTEFGAPASGYIAGTFSGQVVDDLNGWAIVPISGRFRIKRSN